MHKFLGTTVQNLVAREPWRQRFVQPWLREIWGFE